MIHFGVSDLFIFIDFYTPAARPYNDFHRFFSETVESVGDNMPKERE